MDISVRQKPSHKEWRRKVKKERRRRLRRKAAQERDADADRLRAALERTAEYLTWIKEQEEKESQEEFIEQQKSKEEEQEWLERELRAQEEWRALQERREKARQAQLEQEEMLRKEYEAKQEALRKKQEEEKRRIEEELKKHEEVQKQINDYIDNGAKTPEFLRSVTETQPGKPEICQFYTKTGACRYGDMCSRNHLKLSLSKVILIPGFYSHYSLENNAADRDADAGLEYENSEMRQHFEEFYKDVVPELESFGRIKTLKFCSNTEPHLRGNLYVEYYSERDAARAVRKLKGRWFARRQLHCEFTGIKSWRTAICGMARCPKGKSCNFLHVFRNPNNEYDVKSPPRWVKRLEEQESSKKDGSRRSENRHKSNWDDSVRGDLDNNGRNWRWDSPEAEADDRKGEGRRRYPDDRHQSSRRSNYASSSRSRNHDEGRSNRDFEDYSDEEYHLRHYRNSSVRSRRHDDEHWNGEEGRHRRSDYGRHSNRSGKRSYHSRSDRDRHRKRRQERAKSRERASPNGREKRRKRSAICEEKDLEVSKLKTEETVNSKWDVDSPVSPAESNSSSSSSSSPASSSTSSSSSSEESTVEPEPEPKPSSAPIPEYYEWDTTESEDEK